MALFRSSSSAKPKSNKNNGPDSSQDQDYQANQTYYGDDGNNNQSDSYNQYLQQQQQYPQQQYPQQYPNQYSQHQYPQHQYAPQQFSMQPAPLQQPNGQWHPAESSQYQYANEPNQESNSAMPTSILRQTPHSDAPDSKDAPPKNTTQETNQAGPADRNRHQSVATMPDYDAILKASQNEPLPNTNLLPNTDLLMSQASDSTVIAEDEAGEELSPESKIDLNIGLQIIEKAIDEMSMNLPSDFFTHSYLACPCPRCTETLLRYISSYLKTVILRKAASKNTTYLKERSLWLETAGKSVNDIFTRVKKFAGVLEDKQHHLQSQIGKGEHSAARMLTSVSAAAYSNADVAREMDDIFSVLGERFSKIQQESHRFNLPNPLESTFWREVVDRNVNSLERQLRKYIASRDKVDIESIADKDCAEMLFAPLIEGACSRSGSHMFIALQISRKLAENFPEKELNAAFQAAKTQVPSSTIADKSDDQEKRELLNDLKSGVEALTIKKKEETKKEE